MATTSREEKLSQDSGSDEGPSYLIMVPQKCYGFITPQTPKEFKGLHTSGLNTCSGIVLLVHDVDNRYCFLCHADAQTDLSCMDHGLQAWLHKIPQSVSNIVIEYDDADDGRYRREIEPIIKQIDDPRINLRTVEPESTKLVVLRSGRILRGESVSMEHTDELGYENVPNDIDASIGRIYEGLSEGEQASPICIFNGTSSKRPRDIFRSQPQLEVLLRRHQGEEGPSVSAI